MINRFPSNSDHPSQAYIQDGQGPIANSSLYSPVKQQNLENIYFDRSQPRNEYANSDLPLFDSNHRQASVIFAIIRC